MSLRLGKNIALISAAALVLAACSKDQEFVETSPAPEQEPVVTDTTNNDGGRPDTVNTAELTAEQLLSAGTFDAFEEFSGADRVLFAYDSSELSSTARGILAKQAEWLNRNRSVRIRIEGHCDERGTREYNLALGDRRATAVKNYLVALGVPATRMDTISYGKERPVVPGDFAKNRRGEVKFR
ncbi:peptidoglycan-associated lipoprotein [Kordiimonas laminariae]|uniref:peptidoglycan-associated lipoprotein n=1 Tax=Kordiimonas laminariae TaxID=2917717 RepID=UPI001FF3AA34|nr:OmpA family protein [Kordiimonas laminariae]MCK0068624.1 OmpA family protein [Kordiimonas laminariae]